jgi:hypothetical protein
MTANATTDYFRRDQESGITAPDLSKDCAFAEHVVRARGKRTRFTSVSLDKTKIDDFGPALYQARRPTIASDGHAFIEHTDLIASLRMSAASSTKAERVRALQALRYAQRRKEGLIDWRFNIDSIGRKDYVSFGYNAVQKYFARA